MGGVSSARGERQPFRPPSTFLPPATLAIVIRFKFFSAVDANALDAARELQVDVVLDGTLHRVGDRIRINMTLVRASDGTTLWGRTFNTTLADVFQVEDEIATGVVSGLRLQLSSSGPSPSIPAMRSRAPRRSIPTWRSRT